MHSPSVAKTSRSVGFVAKVAGASAPSTRAFARLKPIPKADVEAILARLADGPAEDYDVLSIVD
jgi:hypothetical protein